MLSGGSGADLLGGSWGADRFDFDAVADSGPDQRDTITDFNAAHADVIDLADIDADWSRSGNEAFQFIGTAEFHNSPGELRFTTAGGDGLLEADNDGDGVANLQIVLLGVTALSGGDIIL